MLTNTNAQSLFLETVKAGDVKQVAAYLNHPLIDPAARDNWAICLAAKNGHLEVVRRLLQDTRVNPAASDNEAICEAAEKGHLEVVRLLLQDTRVNPAADNNYAIRWAACYGHLEVVRLLLQDTRVNPAASDNYAIRSAAEKGHLEVVRRLLQDTRVNPAARDNWAICDAAHYGYPEVVRLLLQDKRVNPAASDNYAIREAAEKGHLEVVRRLLQDTRVNPAARDNSAIRGAAYYGHLEVVRRLLQDMRVNPAASDNWAIRDAAYYGHLEVVRLLLQDTRVNPAARDNYAIRGAARSGHLEVVRLLLQDTRVNPAASDNWAIREAAYYGYPEVVRLLLQDTRVNPAERDNQAICLAAQNGHLEVVRLLLQDTRVNPAERDNQAIREAAQKGHPKIVCLLAEHLPAASLSCLSHVQAILQQRHLLWQLCYIRLLPLAAATVRPALKQLIQHPKAPFTLQDAATLAGKLYQYHQSHPNQAVQPVQPAVPFSTQPGKLELETFHAQLERAIGYHFGLGVDKDRQRSHELFGQLAKESPGIQALCLHHGLGLPAQPKQAEGYYQAALAKQQHALQLGYRDLLTTHPIANAKLKLQLLSASNLHSLQLPEAKAKQNAWAVCLAQCLNPLLPSNQRWCLPTLELRTKVWQALTPLFATLPQPAVGLLQLVRLAHPEQCALHAKPDCAAIAACCQQLGPSLPTPLLNLIEHVLLQSCHQLSSAPSQPMQDRLKQIITAIATPKLLQRLPNADIATQLSAGILGADTLPARLQLH